MASRKNLAGTSNAGLNGLLAPATAVHGPTTLSACSRTAPDADQLNVIVDAEMKACSFA
jgi:hypothetical protein